jgi:asparagine synthase (glutamine-hydrolysing)
MRPYQIRDIFLPDKRKIINHTLEQQEQDETRFRNGYEASFYYDLKYSVGSHHVFRDDLSAMRYGLEMRYPYLDHTLVEWVAQLPLSLRYDGKVNKPLLRATAAHYIEGTNLSMPKKGFSLPIVSWWQENKEIRSYMEAQLAALKKRGIFNNHTIDDWRRNGRSFLDLSKIWQLVTTELWMQTYID